MADRIEKVSDTEIKITKTEIVEKTISLLDLKLKMQQIDGDLAQNDKVHEGVMSRLLAKKADLQMKIDEAIALGVIEVVPVVVIEPPIDVEPIEPIVEK